MISGAVYILGAMGATCAIIAADQADRGNLVRAFIAILAGGATIITAAGVGLTCEVWFAASPV